MEGLKPLLVCALRGIFSPTFPRILLEQVASFMIDRNMEKLENVISEAFKENKDFYVKAVSLAYGLAELARSSLLQIASETIDVGKKENLIMFVKEGVEVDLNQANDKLWTDRLYMWLYAMSTIRNLTIPEWPMTQERLMAACPRSYKTFDTLKRRWLEKQGQHSVEAQMHEGSMLTVNIPDWIKLVNARPHTVVPKVLYVPECVFETNLKCQLIGYLNVPDFRLIARELSVSKEEILIASFGVHILQNGPMTLVFEDSEVAENDKGEIEIIPSQKKTNHRVMIVFLRVDRTVKPIMFDPNVKKRDHIQEVRRHSWDVIGKYMIKQLFPELSPLPFVNGGGFAVNRCVQDRLQREGACFAGPCAVLLFAASTANAHGSTKPRESVEIIDLMINPTNVKNKQFVNYFFQVMWKNPQKAITLGTRHLKKTQGSPPMKSHAVNRRPQKEDANRETPGHPVVRFAANVLKIFGNRPS